MKKKYKNIVITHHQQMGQRYLNFGWTYDKQMKRRQKEIDPNGTEFFFKVEKLSCMCSRLALI